MPTLFLKNKKIALILGKNTLIVSIYGLNVSFENISFKMRFQKHLGHKYPKYFSCQPWYTKLKLAELGQTKPAEIWQVKSVITKQIKVRKSQENLTISQYYSSKSALWFKFSFTFFYFTYIYPIWSYLKNLILKILQNLKWVVVKCSK